MIQFYTSFIINTDRGTTDKYIVDALMFSKYFNKIYVKIAFSQNEI